MKTLKMKKKAQAEVERLLREFERLEAIDRHITFVIEQATPDARSYEQLRDGSWRRVDRRRRDRERTGQGGIRRGT
jgi:hypothetical protein